MGNQIKRGEIYYADLNPAIGSEQGGIRPVVILQNDTGNRHSPTVIVAAITSQTDKHPLPTHVSLTAPFLEKDSVVLLEQLQTIDKSRLQRYVGTFPPERMRAIERAAEISLGLSSIHFRGQVHKEIFEKTVERLPREPSGRMVAALYLLTADNLLWKTTRPAIENNYIYFERIRLETATMDGYVLFNAAKGIYTGESGLTLGDLSNRGTVSDTAWVLIQNAISLSRNGEKQNGIKHHSRGDYFCDEMSILSPKPKGVRIDGNSCAR
ncbi:MAG: type II toxin-antitoxin system PemK/MazF family toxin [Clostridia bacterium]|nr:type II toxin-antitoxin system PemK/MazF family toxin [Clostridia bacterium]